MIDYLSVPFIILQFIFLPIFLGQMILNLNGFSKTLQNDVELILSFLIGICLKTCIAYILSVFNLLNYPLLNLSLFLVIFLFFLKFLDKLKIITYLLIENTFLNWSFWLAFSIPMLYELIIYAYPLRDIFAGMHYLRGAFDIATYSFINPFNTDSYLPFMQEIFASSVLVSRLSLLEIEKITSISFFIIQFFTILSLVSRITHNKFKRNLLIISYFALSVAPFTISNSELANCTIIAFICIFLDLRISSNTREHTLPLSLLGIALLILVKLIDNALISQLDANFKFLPISILLLSMLLLSYFFRKKENSLLIIALIITVTYAFHRSGFASLAIVLIGTLISSLRLSKKNLALQIKINKFVNIDFLSLVIIALALLSLFGQFLVSINIVAPTELILKYQFLIYKKLFPGSDFYLAFSPISYIRNNFIEIIKIFSPLKLAMIVTILFSFLHGKHKEDSDKSTSILLLLWGSVFLLINLMFPFGYRLLSLLAIIYIPLLINSNILNVGKLNFLTRVLLACSIVVSSLFYLVNFDKWIKSNFYLQQVSFLRITMLIIALFLILLIILNNKWTKRFFPSLLIFLLCFETIFVRIFFFPHSYGPEGHLPISHYDQQDLEYSKKIKTVILQEKISPLIFSAPPTMVNYSVFTNSPTSYAVDNLATIPNDFADKLRAFLAKIIYSSEIVTFNEIDNFLISNKRSNEAFFSRRKRNMHNNLQNNNSYLIIVNSNALSWIAGHYNYFPDNRSLPLILTKNIKKRYSLTSNYNNRLIQILIKQSEE